MPKEERRKLPMTDGEIITSYRQAASPLKQIKILADLNGCASKDICIILEEAGLEIPGQFGPKDKKKGPEIQEPAPEKAAEEAAPAEAAADAPEKAPAANSEPAAKPVHQDLPILPVIEEFPLFSAADLRDAALVHIKKAMLKTNLSFTDEAAVRFVYRVQDILEFIEDLQQ